MAQMKTMDFDARQLAAALLVTTSLVVVATCSGRGAIARSPAQTPTASASGSDGTEPDGLPIASSGSSFAAPNSDGHAADGVSRLNRFFQALDDLEAKRRQDHVRVVWLGDSHAAADFWTGQVRRKLQDQFGDGGPGFLRIGVKPYRHSRVKVEVQGSWLKLPKQPSRSAPFLDGVFGLGGIRAIPKFRGWSEITPHASSVRGTARWSLLYRAPEGASFKLSLGSAQHVIDAKTAAEAVDGSSIRRLRLEGAAADPLRISYRSGQAEIFGAILESSEPGVVVDTCGIDGARLATLLAWDEAAWVAELQARAPELVVLAFGTNEVFEARAAEEYARHLKDLVARVRRAAPKSACLVVGPTDVAERDGASNPRVREIESVQRHAAKELGCAFIDAQALMGGEGSFARWSGRKPAFASGDRVHLTVHGYRELGERTSRVLLDAYAKR